MRKIKQIWINLCLISLIIACEDKEWDSHYSQKDMVIDNTEIESVDAEVSDYIKNRTDLSLISEVLENQGILKAIKSKDQLFTLIVFPDDKLQGKVIEDPEYFAKTLICDLYIAPSKCTNGMQLLTWGGKYLDVTVTEENISEEDAGTKAEEGAAEKVIRIGGQKITRVVQLNNAFVYELEEPVFVPKSVYEYLEWLDDETYSKFKGLVRSYEVKEFDKANSTPAGVDNTGNTVYDSVFIITNSFLDRYKKNDYATSSWNIRSEFDKTTMLIPTNEQIQTAIENACSYVINSLSRQPTAEDSVNFNEWILNACFYSGIVNPDQFAPSAITDLKSIGGYCKKYTAAVDQSLWRPSVQKVNIGKQVELSNGVAYFIESFKIPNNVVLWRLKNRMYPCWKACTPEQKEEYFQWVNINNTEKIVGGEDPYAPTGRNIAGSNGPYGDFPVLDYTALFAPPSRAVCTADSALYGQPVSLTFTLVKVDANGSISPVLVPPGEYYLRAGASTLKNGWTANWYIKDTETNEFAKICSGWIPANCYVDRYGTGYPKYYNPAAFGNSSNAKNYDRDGGDVGTITVKGSGPQLVVLKIESEDLYKTNGMTTTRDNVLSIYHWSLRPTENNY